MMDQEYNYTEWQREFFDGVSPDELLRMAVEYEQSDLIDRGRKIPDALRRSRSSRDAAAKKIIDVGMIK